MSDFLKIDRNGEILEITLDRPKANALDAPASREMGEIFARFRDDPELRVAILTGAGEKFFSGGWDLNAVADGEEYLDDFGAGGFGGFVEMSDLLKPVICAVNGMAVGAGFEMLLRAVDLEGRIVVRFVIDIGTGKVVAVSIGETELESQELEACIAQRVKAWSFPSVEGGGTVVVNYPFMLQLVDEEDG